LINSPVAVEISSAAPRIETKSVARQASLEGPEISLIHVAVPIKVGRSEQGNRL
jgi:hypothetical protein